MTKRPMTDREAYPAAWMMAAVLGIAFLIWKYGLGAPAISRCWIWEHWHLYCPGCGGTRAVIALAHGRILQSFYYHPAVPITVGLVSVYMISQTCWRLRGQRGWALRYDQRWPGMLVGLFLANCAVRNLLWLGLGIPI